MFKIRIIKNQLKIVVHRHCWLIFYLENIWFFSIVYLYFPHDFSRDIMHYFDSLYFSVITMTTLGYGEIHPESNVAKLFVSIQSLIGILLLGAYLNNEAKHYHVFTTKLRFLNLYGIIKRSTLVVESEYAEMFGEKIKWDEYKNPIGRNSTTLSTTIKKLNDGGTLKLEKSKINRICNVISILAVETRTLSGISESKNENIILYLSRMSVICDELYENRIAVREALGEEDHYNTMIINDFLANSTNYLELAGYLDAAIKNQQY